jgi:pyrroline-5-carboxylate reductase
MEEDVKTMTTAAGSAALETTAATSAPRPLPQAPPCRVAIVGAGTMGRAIATGIVRAGLLTPDRIAVSDRTSDVASALMQELGVAAAFDNATACADADVVFLCVKPADVAAVLDELVEREALGHAPLLISIAAGVRIPTLEERTGARLPVIRAMPNTACRIGRGMTVLARGTLAAESHLETAHALFGALGRCMVLDERHFDTVTAVSASGPAFVYVLLEAIAEGGVMCGLPRAVATELAAQMALGACEMVLTTGRHPAALKDDVTTPGGCTVAGLLALEDGRVRSVLARAIQTTAQVAAGLT